MKPPASDATDAQLMTRVAGGDVVAFELIYDRYHVQAYSLARSIAGRIGAAEDATQDAFLALWRLASRFDPARAALGSWLLTLVRNRSIDLLRRKGTFNVAHDWSEHALERLPAFDSTEEQVLDLEDGREARRQLAALPREQRQVIELTYFGGYSQKEIAQGMGVPLGTVKSRARLGLIKLRQADFVTAA